MGILMCFLGRPDVRQMMNTPVEDQDELISLVNQVTGILGVHEPLLEGLQSSIASVF